MPFRSKSQEKAAFAGYLGPEMKSKAKSWAAMTDQKSLPAHVKKARMKHNLKNAGK